MEKEELRETSPLVSVQVLSVSNPRRLCKRTVAIFPFSETVNLGNTVADVR
jgi:hypothetical protein